MEIQKLLNEYVYWPELENSYKKNIDFSDTPINEFHSLFSKFCQGNKTQVESNIIRFYCLNEILSKIRQDSHEILDKEAVELYQQYTLELEQQSQQMLTYLFFITLMESRHNLFSKQIKSLNNSYTDIPNYYDLSKEEQKKAIDDFKGYGDKYKKDIINNLCEYDSSINKEKFSIFFEIVMNLSENANYSDRSASSDLLLELISDNKFMELNIGECLSYLRIIFKYNYFESGYGGIPWANIAEHAENFVKGKINAEVFIDQAFSLEHNGGQIFNKQIIFKDVQAEYWKTAIHDKKMHPSSFSIVNSQFLLNAQHQGYLLSMLKQTFDESGELNKFDYGLDLTTEEIQKIYDKYNLLFSLEEKGINLNNMIDVFPALYSNMSNLRSIISKFKISDPKFMDLISRYKISTPSFDLIKVLNNCMSQHNGDIVLTEKHHLFYQMANSFIKPKAVTKYSKKHSKPYHYSFELINTKDVPSDKLNKEHLGNKAFGLAQMHQNSLPVPDALVFPTTNAQSFFSEKTRWLRDVRTQLNTIKNTFKDKEGNPIAFSVRSGSSISMPGMMDTILNVGIDDTNYEYFCEKMGKSVTDECVKKFMTLFIKSLTGEQAHFSGNIHKSLFEFRKILEKHDISQNFENKFPLNARQQLRFCLEAVFNSWNSERAIAYRNYHDVPHDIGTAAIVQQMVFGNLNDNSCTGVVFSRDCINGKKGIIGEFLPKAQGEDVVSGAVTPLNISELQNFNPEAYKDLLQICEKLEKETGDIQDIEFTIEDGQLYILQKRKAVCSPIAQHKLNTELYESGLIDNETLLSSVQIEHLIKKQIVDTSGQESISEGLIGNPGIIREIVVHSKEDMDLFQDLFEQYKKEPNFGWIFCAKETSPEHAPIMIKTDAFITGNGGFTSHAAILARSWNKPCVVGVGEEDILQYESGKIITVDANNGKIYDNILPLIKSEQNDIKNMVDKILEHYNVDVQNIHIETISHLTDTINKQKFWTEGYVSSRHLVDNKNSQEVNYLELEQRLAIMLVKEKSRIIKEGVMTTNKFNPAKNI